MAHFAKLNADNVVVDVVVVNNNELLDENGQELEVKGITFLHSLLGPDVRWVQTSYNNNFRRRYAVIGGGYSSSADAFYHPQPYPSWSLDVDMAEWVPPVPYPVDGNEYIWSEELVDWVPKPSVPYPDDGLEYRWDEASKSWVELETNIPT
jgi:hypothetical protein